MTRRRRLEHFKVTKLKRTYNRQTATFTFDISYQTAPAKRTRRTQEISEAFGLGTDQTRKFTLYENTQIHIRPTDVVLITGESGSGKSALLKAFKADLSEEAQNTQNLNIEVDVPIIETVGDSTSQAVEVLSRVGLNDAFLFLRSYSQLSDGQKHRYHIAKLSQTKAKWWLLDEFTNTLDRDTAKIVAFNLQKLARIQGKAVIVATTHTDLKADLAPNVHIHKRYGKEVTITYCPDAKAKKCSLNRRLRVEQGTIQDYKLLSQFHYRTGRLTAPKKIFALKHKDQTCGVIVYGYPSPLCFGRSKMWKGTFRELQQQVSVISRVVIHPKYRSIGLSQKLIRQTLPRAGTPNVEAVAVMARYNPFFEKAGMRRVAQSTPSVAVEDALLELEGLGFDLALLSSESYSERRIQQVGKEKIQGVLEVLSRKDAAMRKRIASAPKMYPKHEETRARIHAMTAKDLAKALKRLSFAAQTKVYLFWSKNHPK
ncbi:MAG: ATP-binding cassette domain-containing protein [Candidatus Bathyarchaeota archaeon]|nr:ATP-binding cassette domain-containing protein [Candidatus Bathyarchaeota archaeon]